MCVPGEAMYEACASRVEKFLYKKLLKVSEAAQLDFFSLSFFYDRAVDLQLLRTIRVLSYLILKMRRNEKSWFSGSRSSDHHWLLPPGGGQDVLGLSQVSWSSELL